MISILCSLGRKSLPLLAVLIVCLLPAVLQAQTITIKNATPGAVIVTTTYLIPGRPPQVKSGRPIALNPGATTVITPLAAQVRITILDAAQPNGKPLGGKDVVMGTTEITLEIVPSADPKWKVALQPKE